MPWVNQGQRCIEITEDEQRGPRPRPSMTKDGLVCAQDVWVRSPAPEISIAGPLAVTGAFYPATQAVSIAAPVAVTGSFWQSTQPVSGPLTDAQLRAAGVAVTGTFWQATQPVSIASLPLPAGAAAETTLAALNTKTPALGQAAMAASSPVVIASNQSAIPVNATAIAPSSLSVTVTAAANTLTTCTLPAVVGQFHYIVSVSITMYAIAARTGAATPVVTTTTNLPGNPAFTWETAQAIGTAVRQQMELGGNPLKSAVANTATTFACPATASVIWRVTVVYYTAP